MTAWTWLRREIAVWMPILPDGSIRRLRRIVWKLEITWPATRLRRGPRNGDRRMQAIIDFVKGFVADRKVRAAALLLLGAIVERLTNIVGQVAP